MNWSLALGGGGLKGAAHVGVLQVLADEGLQPGLIVGTSAGSIVAALYAAGYRPPATKSLFLRYPRHFFPESALVVPEAHSIDGLLDGWPLEALLRSLLGGRTFEELAYPVAVVATDLSTGDGVVFLPERMLPRKPLPGFRFVGGARVHEAVRASIGIPGIFKPKVVGDFSLVDGGVVDNVPADVARHLLPGPAVAVDVGYFPRSGFEAGALHRVLVRAAETSVRRVSDLVLKEASLVLRPDTGPAALWDVHRLPEILASGKKEAESKLDRLREIVSGY